MQTITMQPNLYDAYVEADFVGGGMENSDVLTKDQALLREIIEERYVSGFGTYMPFNDHRRLRGSGETNLIPPFPFNNANTSEHVERLPGQKMKLFQIPALIKTRVCLRKPK